MNDRWKCPDCRAWVAREVQEHRCPDAGLGAPLPQAPHSPLPGQILGHLCGCGLWVMPGTPHSCYSPMMPYITTGGVTISGVDGASSYNLQTRSYAEFHRA